MGLRRHTRYPADSETYTVWKKASETALQGSRGASGIIQVKTKKGTGRGFQICYDGKPADIEGPCARGTEMLNAAEHIAAARILGLEYKR
jgi:hypothetical protein